MTKDQALSVLALAQNGMINTGLMRAMSMPQLGRFQRVAFSAAALLRDTPEHPRDYQALEIALQGFEELALIAHGLPTT